MSVQVKVYQVNGNRLARLSRELEYINAQDFLRTVPLAEERKEVQQYMEGISPRGDNPSMTKVWLAERGLRKMLPQFATGWRIKRVTTGNRLTWQISHILETSPLKGAQAKFRSIEFGSNTTTWNPPRAYKFRDSYGRWHSFSEESTVVHWGNEPADIISKTSDFVRLVMVPQIAAKVSDIIESRLDRV